MCCYHNANIVMYSYIIASSDNHESPRISSARHFSSAEQVFTSADQMFTSVELLRGAKFTCAEHLRRALSSGEVVRWSSIVNCYCLIKYTCSYYYRTQEYYKYKTILEDNFTSEIIYIDCVAQIDNSITLWQQISTKLLLFVNICCK